MINTKDHDLHRKLANLGFEPHRAFKTHEFPGVYAHRGLGESFPVLTLGKEEVTIFYPLGDEIEVRMTDLGDLLQYLNDLVLKNVFES